MKFPFISAAPAEQSQAPLDLPAPPGQEQMHPAGYLPDQNLVNAANIALLLGQPLLLTGEAGTGKTQLAHWLSWRLGFGEALVFNTKSTSTARDLFYTFDSMRRFHAAHSGQGSQNEIDYVTYNALGVAILRSRSKDSVAHLVAKGFEHAGPRRSVVLIDEIDKAPRDFPNDLLHEVEHMSFRIPELRNEEVKADKTLRPVLVLTSNSEKNLPDAFLRRCVFFHIPFPDREQLKRIVKSRLRNYREGPDTLLESALDLFIQVHEGGTLRKVPSTAELINWLQTLDASGAQKGKPVSSEHLQISEVTLAKTTADAEELHRLLTARLTG